MNCFLWKSEKSEDSNKVKRRLTDIVNETFDLALHAPVAELDSAQFVGAHEGHSTGNTTAFLLHHLAVVFAPVVSERTSGRLLRNEQARVLFTLVIATTNWIGDNVQKI